MQIKVNDKKYDKIEAGESNNIFIPPSGRDLNLDLYIELLKDEDISIRPADKGFVIVVMESKYYISKVTTYLNENDSYEKLPKNTTTTVRNKVNKIVNES